MNVRSTARQELPAVGLTAVTATVIVSCYCYGYMVQDLAWTPPEEPARLMGQHTQRSHQSNRRRLMEQSAAARALVLPWLLQDCRQCSDSTHPVYDSINL